MGGMETLMFKMFLNLLSKDIMYLNLNPILHLGLFKNPFLILEEVNLNLNPNNINSIISLNSNNNKTIISNNSNNNSNNLIIVSKITIIMDNKTNNLNLSNLNNLFKIITVVVITVIMVDLKVTILLFDFIYL